MAEVSGWIAIGLTIATFFAAIRAPILNRAFGHLKHQLAIHHYLGLGFMVFMTCHLIVLLRDFSDNWSLLFDISDQSLLTGWLAFISEYILVGLAFKKRTDHYRRWRIIHLLTFLGFVIAVLHVHLIIEPRNWPELLLIGIPLGLGFLFFFLASVGPQLRFWGKRYQVDHIHKFNDQIYDLSISPSRSKDRIKVTAGEFIYVRFSGPNFTRMWHPLTVINHPGANAIEMAIKIRGRDTSQLNTLESGSFVQVRGPFGQDIWKTPSPQLWIANGIGVSIFLGGMRSVGCNPRFQAHLMYCEVNKDQLLLQEDMSRFAESKSGFSWQVYLCSGYEFVKTLKEKASFLSNFKTYRVCGHPDFQKSVRQVLIDLGIKRKQIILEGL